ncbi:MAG TPA: sigma-70 family RNA polymerase sigma factor [Thermoleophilaceae bacterium]|jgi:putative glutamine amidotransferase
MDFDALYDELRDPLTRRLERLVGDARTAEDLRQEAFARAWKSGPRDAGRGHMRAWLHRTAHNLAVDELRRRSLRDSVPYDEDLAPAFEDADADERIAAREAVARLSAHDRFLLLMRFEAGLTHAEIGQLLAIGEDAARKRVARARAALAAAHREVTPRERPLVLVLVGDDVSAPYERWIEAAGGEPRVLDVERFERQLASADALVVTGSHSDIHPSLYGHENRGSIGELDLGRDRRDLAAVHAALVQEVPLVGICRGHQLLNVAFGGTLHQDISRGRRDRSLCHEAAEHSIGTGPRSLARRVLGRSATVASGHHQAVRRLGRGLRATSASPDGVVETLEVPGHRFAVGVQWHPERDQGARAGEHLAAALVEAAR